MIRYGIGLIGLAFLASCSGLGKQLFYPPKERIVELPGEVLMEFVWIKPDSWGTSGIHDGFYMAKYKMNQAQLKGVLGPGPWITHDFPIRTFHFAWAGTGRGGSEPIKTALTPLIGFLLRTNVKTLIQRLNQGDQQARYRLPTRAEWVYACGPDTQRPAKKEKMPAFFAEMDESPANVWGLHHTQSSVEEWTQERAADTTGWGPISVRLVLEYL